GKNGTSTDTEGNYMLIITDDSQSVIFRAKGYLTQRHDVDSEEGNLEISLQYDVHGKDDIVQLGYTSQTRGDISGAVSTVSGEELERAPVANLSQSFPGRLSGLTTQETFSELSRATTDLFVRGLST